VYAIERAIKKGRRFAINVLPVSEKQRLIQLSQMRRRQPRKGELLGLELSENEHRIPFFKGSLRTLFCEVEQVIPSGDRQLYVARVLSSALNDHFAGQRPLLFGEITPSRFPSLRDTARTIAIRSGGLDILRKAKSKLRPPPPANIAKTTYDLAGMTDEEIKEIESYGLLDVNHTVVPPAAPAIAKRKVGICVVGTRWGAFHCRTIKKASSSARLFVCGQDERRTARLAKAVGAEDFIVGLENAIADERVQALTLALPHNFHREATEMAAAAGKHVMVEKPIATKLSDADAMIAAVRSAGTILMVAENMHFRPGVNEVVRRITRGDIGEPLYFFAHAAGVRRLQGGAAQAEQMGGGVLMDLGVHYARAVRLLMGEPDQAMASKAMQINTKMAAEDSVQAILSSRVGWQAHMILSWASQRGHLPDIVVEGEKGTFHLWPFASYIDYYPVSPTLPLRLLSYVRPYALQERLMRPSLGRVRVRLSNSESSAYVAEVREFLSAVSEGRESASGPEDGRRDLEIVLRCYDALKSQSWVEIPPFDK
jgi:predicted dehydrogenase